RLDRFYKAELMLGARAREHVYVAHRFLQRRFVHLLDFRAGDRGLAVADAEHLGDRRCSYLVVAGDHRDADTTAVTFFYRFDRLLARGIEKADEAEQDEILRQVGRAEAARLDYRTLEPGEPKHAFTLSGELVRDLPETVAVERRMFAVGELLPVAVLHDHFRRALDEEHFLSIGSLVQCRHEFVLRLERNGVDSGICGLLSSTIHSELCSERIERSLSG